MNSSWEATYDHLFDLYQNGSAVDALTASNAAWPAVKRNLGLASLCAAISIDRGGELDDRLAIQRGINLFQRISQSNQLENPVRVRARYNLANGYGALAKSCERAKDKSGRLEAWRQEREILQNLLLNRAEIPADMLPQVLTNFGNALSQLGRQTEALSYYAEAITLEPDHPVAHGSAGRVCIYLLGIQPIHDIRLLARSRELLQNALTNMVRLNVVGGQSAAEEYKASLKQCEQRTFKTYGGVAEFEARVKELQTHCTWSPEPLLASWMADDLLLSVNPYPEWCSSTAKDDLFFNGLRTTADEAGERRFQELAQSFNQIKEDFATARHLYSQSRERTQEHALGSVTQYARTSDQADFSLPSGLLKASLKHSVDALDKVASFLNRYLELKIRRVSFANIWFENGVMRDDIRQDGKIITSYLQHNTFLAGIRDVSETMNRFPAPAKLIRNKATHDMVVIENHGCLRVRIGGEIVASDAHELARQLLVMLKGVIINLVAFVQWREGELGRNNTQSVPQLFEYGTGLSDANRTSGLQ